MKLFMHQGESYESLYLKRKTWEALKSINNWPERGATSRLAEAIGVTRQYASGIVAGNHEGGCGVSTNIAIRIKNLLGIRGGCWCHLFEERKAVGIDPNHPLFNKSKFDGVMPYREHSLSAEHRKLDYPAETR